MHFSLPGYPGSSESQSFSPPQPPGPTTYKATAPYIPLLENTVRFPSGSNSAFRLESAHLQRWIRNSTNLPDFPTILPLDQNGSPSSYKGEAPGLSVRILCVPFTSPTQPSQSLRWKTRTLQTSPSTTPSDKGRALPDQTQE